MADRDLTNILDKRAAFGANFLGTTNLAQRRRYQEDIEAARMDQESRKRSKLESDLEAAMSTMDPIAAARLKFQMQREGRIAEDADESRSLRREGLDFRKENALRDDEFRIQDALRDDEFRREQLQIRTQLQEESLRLRERQVIMNERRTLRALKDKERIDNQTLAVEEADFELRESGMLPGSPEYANAIKEQLVRNPYADPALRKSLVEQARIDVDPEELVSLAADNPGLSISTTPEGRKVFRMTAPKPTGSTGASRGSSKVEDFDKQRMDMQARFESFVEKSQEAKKDKDQQLFEYYNGLAEAARSRMIEFEKPKATADEIKSIQSKLKGEGLYFGDVTGVDSDETSNAIRRFQTRNGLEVTGRINDQIKGALAVPNVQLNSSQPAAVSPAQKPIVPLRLDGGKLIPR